MRRSSLQILVLGLSIGFVVGCAAPVPVASPGAGTLALASPTSSPAPAQQSPTRTVLTPTASPAPSPAPSASLIPVPTASPTVSTLPSATPTLSATPRPSLASGWIGPASISNRGYNALSLVVDADGTAHAAAVLGDDVFYLSNASGEWTRERLTNGSRTRARVTAYGQPDLALDDDGSLALAYVGLSGHPRDPFGPYAEAIYFTTNRGGSWSPPAVVADDDAVHSPSLQLREGRFHVAYQAGYAVDLLVQSERYPIRYATDAGGELSDAQVVAHGTQPTLRLGLDGAPHILFGDEYGLLPNESQLRYATAAPGTNDFAVEAVSGSRDDDATYNLEIDADGRPLISWMTDSDDRPVVYIQRLEDGAWSDAEIDLGSLGLDGNPGVLAATTDGSGNWHMIVQTATYVYGEDDEYTLANQAVYYVTTRGGTLRAELLQAALAWAGAITIDDRGRPHLLFGVPAGFEDESVESETGLWYAIGPLD